MGFCGAGMDASNRAIDASDEAPSRVTAPACRIRDGIVGSGSGSGSGSAAPDDDLFGIQARKHVLVTFPVSMAAGPMTFELRSRSSRQVVRAWAALLRGHEPADISSSMRLPAHGVNRHHPIRLFARVITRAFRQDSHPARSLSRGVTTDVRRRHHRHPGKCDCSDGGKLSASSHTAWAWGPALAGSGVTDLPGPVQPNLDETMRSGRKVLPVAVVHRGDHGGVGQLPSYQAKHSLCGRYVETLRRFV